jgi:hypothetical protein
MIAEQNVKLWIHLSPYAENAYDLPIASSNLPSEYKSNKHCEVFPLQYFTDINSIYANGISNFSIHLPKHYSIFNTSNNSNTSNNTGSSNSNTCTGKDDHSNTSDYPISYMNMSYNLKFKSRITTNGKRQVRFDTSYESESDSAAWRNEQSTVSHIWFFGWKDFDIPSNTHQNVLLLIMYMYIYNILCLLKVINILYLCIRNFLKLLIMLLICYTKRK